jgi:hypothetical protein
MLSDPLGPSHPPTIHAPAKVGCLRPLLFLAADAAVEQDGVRVAAALGALARLVAAGGAPVAAAAAMEPLLPLLLRLVTGE